MNRVVAGNLLLSVFVSFASASDLNVTVTSGGSSTVNVSPGAPVPYVVTGVLSDTNNEGLAAVLFDLTFSGGALSQADTPTANPMLNFTRNAGLTNPAGYGGTIVGGALIQVGGAQNTIKNTPANAPFPIGTVIPDVGQSSVTLVTGSLTAPMANGAYTLTLSNLVASVIKPGEDGTGTFWATESANAGTIGNLTVNVAGTTPFTGMAEGPRYIAVTPPSGSSSIAFLITGDAGNSAVSCVNAYVQADGRLAASAVFQTPAQWGPVVHVGDSEVLPNTNYNVQMDDGVILSAPVMVTTWRWGDVTHSEAVDLDDILCLLGGFGGNFSSCSRYADDLQPAAPDNAITLDDILAVLSAFSGAVYPGAPPCP